ncbi:RNA polymerase sigma factor (sigma-70 family) [Bradyrhizobium japonicum]
MKALSGDDITSSSAPQPSGGDEPARARPRGNTVSPRHDRRKAARWERWNDCSERWGRLLLAARAGDEGAYERLLRELDLWLRAYYARRLPYPAADDARQEVLLAIHAKRHTFAASKPFGAWVTAIARYKWVDRVRDASRYSALALDEDIAIEDHEGAAISAAALDQLLGRLKPAQESVIRLVKLNGLSIARAAGATGQSAALVKINIHRGLKKLSTLVS